MRILVVIFLLLSGCAKSQMYLGIKSGAVVSPPVDSTNNVLFIFNGESNSGGAAQNDSLTLIESSPRSSLKIFNNTTLLYENLDIGANNLLGHTGLSSATHGWENGFANAADSGNLGNPTYLVKTGQGGSRIEFWVNPIYSIYQNRFQNIDSAISLLTTIKGSAPDLFMFYSQGINDGIAGTDTTVWKNSTKTHFANYRARYGTLPVFMTLLPVNATNDPFNRAILQICSEISDCYAIKTDDALLKEATHWGYSGMKLIAARMIAALKGNYTY